MTSCTNAFKWTIQKQQTVDNKLKTEIPYLTVGIITKQHRLVLVTAVVTQTQSPKHLQTATVHWCPTSRHTAPDDNYTLHTGPLFHNTLSHCSDCTTCMHILVHYSFNSHPPSYCIMIHSNVPLSVTKHYNWYWPKVVTPCRSDVVWPIKPRTLIGKQAWWLWSSRNMASYTRHLNSNAGKGQAYRIIFWILQQL